MKLSFRGVDKQCPYAMVRGDQIWYCLLDKGHEQHHEAGYGQRSNFWFKLDAEWLKQKMEEYQ